MRILPGIRPNLSLINSIFELKDFKSIGKTASHLYQNGKRLLDLLSLGKVKFKKPVSRLTGREINRQSSDIYLQYKFNVAPLLSDLEGIFKSFKRYQAQAMRLVSRSATIQTRHFTVPIIGDSSQIQTELSDGGRFVGASYENSGWRAYVTSKRQQILLPSQFHVEIQYNYHYTAFQKQHAVLFALLDDLGVNFNPAIIWNAIPWSFVVDWTAGVSQYLSTLRRNNLEPVINIQRALWSIKRERHTSCHVDIDCTPGGTQRGVPVSFIKEVAYRRQPFEMTAHSIKSSGLSLTEVSLGAALVSTRRPRHK
jgi:hypothetical protein